MSIKYDEADKKFSNIIEHLNHSLNSIRAGRANTALVENIMVDAYGEKMPINQLANITVVDATLLLVQPWDTGNLETVKKTIELSDLGINPSVDGKNIRLPIPSLTEEKRVEYVKLMKSKLEEARIAIRQVRKDVIDGLDADKDNGALPEDDYDRLTKDLQKTVDKYNSEVEKVGKDKEAELMNV